MKADAVAVSAFFVVHPNGIKHLLIKKGNGLYNLNLVLQAYESSFKRIVAFAHFSFDSVRAHHRFYDYYAARTTNDARIRNYSNSVFLVSIEL